MERNFYQIYFCSFQYTRKRLDNTWVPFQKGEVPSSNQNPVASPGGFPSEDEYPSRGWTLWLIGANYQANIKEPLSGVRATYKEVQQRVEDFCRRFGKAKPPASYPNIKAILLEASLIIKAWRDVLAPTRMLGVQQELVYPLLPTELGRNQQLEVLERLWLAAAFSEFFRFNTQLGAKAEVWPGRGCRKNFENRWENEIYRG